MTSALELFVRKAMKSNNILMVVDSEIQGLSGRESLNQDEFRRGMSLSER